MTITKINKRISRTIQVQRFNPITIEAEYEASLDTGDDVKKSRLQLTKAAQADVVEALNQTKPLQAIRGAD